MIPKKKSHELLSEVIGTSLVERRNPFVLNKHTTAAKALLSLDQENAYLGYIVLGILSCIKGEVDEMRSFHEKAIALFPADPLGHKNYALSLLKMGMFAEAEEFAMKAYDLNEGEGAEDIVDISLFNGRLTKAFALRDRFRATSPKVELDRYAPLMKFIEEKKNAGWSDVSESACARMVETVYDYLHSAGLYYAEGAVALLSDEYGQWIDYEIAVSLSPADIVEHSLKIGARLDALDIPREVRSLFVPRLTNGA